MPSQQATTGPAPMEGVERTNTVMVRGQGQEVGASPRRDPYVIEVDRRRNCYVCRGFGHMAHHCKNQKRERVAKGRREGLYEYKNHLKEKENLETLN